MTSSPRPAGGNQIPIALTMGEPAGIGGELTLKAWLRRGEGIPPFFVIDDGSRLLRLSQRLGVRVPLRAIETPEQAAEMFASELPVLERPLVAEAVPGKPDVVHGPAVRAAIECAVSLTLDRRAAAVVTNPIHKGILHEAGFEFPGHTEFLASLAATATAPVMMLVCRELRVVPVTRHCRLKDVVGSITREVIVETAICVHASLIGDFGIARPRLAVAGLNPHAGEGGTLGSEEIEIIEPAIAALCERDMDVVGPVAADAMFTDRARGDYDAAICMYHDQALIPIKTIDFRGAVNVTLGLPFVRTSPDHGTALDIAGTGTADVSSLVAALFMAAEMAARRGLAE